LTRSDFETFERNKKIPLGTIFVPKNRIFVPKSVLFGSEASANPLIFLMGENRRESPIVEYQGLRRRFDSALHVLGAPAFCTGENKPS